MIPHKFGAACLPHPPMGICNSCEATAVLSTVVSTGTAKLVSMDGNLQEFDRPVRASHVLPERDGFFVCDSDDMEMDGFPIALDEDEELQMGQLYFLLPSSMLRRPLSAGEMAKLAVKASSALVKACRRCAGGTQYCRDDGMYEEAVRNNVDDFVRKRVQRSKSRRTSGKGRNFKPDLGPIAE